MSIRVDFIKKRLREGRRRKVSSADARDLRKAVLKREARVRGATQGISGRNGAELQQPGGGFDLDRHDERMVS